MADFDQYDNGGSGNGFVMGLIAGTVLGAGLGMLLAPKAGSELRGAIGQQARNISNKASDQYRRASESASGWAEKGREFVNQARDADYDDVAKDARAVAKSLRRNAKPEALAERRTQVARLRKRLAQVVSVDFFGAIGREKAESVLSELESRLSEGEVVKGKSSIDSAESAFGTLRDRTWVTRQGVYVDRIASAWLIRRFIDPQARFKFVSGKGYRPDPGELRFDMFEAEFTHEGDKCTFEVLLERCAPKDAALRAIAEIIHDIDLKDDKFGRTEVAGIRTLIEGISVATKDDSDRIARGTEVFNNLYEYFKKKRR